MLVLSSCSKKRSGPPQVLVFSKTAGFVHQSIPEGIAAIQKLGEENGFSVDTTANSEMFNEKNLGKYAAVIFLNTTGDVLDFNQEVAFERYIQSGGGYVGVHAATDTEYGWSWYGRLAGAYFLSHPAIQEADFIINDREFIAMSHLPDSIWTRTDELYNFKNINPNLNVLMTVDESTYEGGENGDYHPMAWFHEYDGGRAFYTAMGHTKETYLEETFLKHLLGGINYAIGENLKLDYDKARTQIPPDDSRFSKYQLAVGDFFEPTEMTILPNNDVLIAQRRGELMRYQESSGELKQVGYLDVYHESGVSGVNAEEGFMGLQKDPNFTENNWLYAFYAPKGDEHVNRLSRFKYTDDTLQMNTEQVILDVASQRAICCHTGGSITFGGDGLLYLSTGDNSTPFDEADADYVNDGFAPLNDLPGKEQYDARRSSGNTNDLRGKIIRIKVNEDGTYDIPEGNLFPVGTEKTRPEIYTMGHRNPYRISVDPKNGNLFWGDIGPDSREDKMDTRGPMGYDEMNIATGPGNFGWPLFIADNKAYRDYDYSNGESGDFFDPEKPINDSRNNTGLTELPPARGAYIYYNYDGSDQFSGLASGGRNAMAGPTYYNDLFDSEEELPSHYDGKTIIYDWMRGWMKAVTFTSEGELESMEPFAPGTELNNLIDMEFGPNGRLYLLEYGSGWFTQNDDSGLSYLKYNEGNQPPVINDFSSDVTSGKVPLTVNLKVDAVDMEEGPVIYTWDFGDGTTETTDAPEISYTYADPGAYDITVEVVDDQQMKVNSQVIKVVSGNTRPGVDIEITGGNSSFFIPGVPVNYAVAVSDAEDGEDGIDLSKLMVRVEYLEGFDEASLDMGHQEANPVANGLALTQSLICKTCHKANSESIGPAYTLIAEKYHNDEDAMSYLINAMQEGSSGVWGSNVMPSNAELTDAQANDISRYILSLAGDSENSSLPPSGIITPAEGQEGKSMIITASYTDNGAPGSSALTGVKRVMMKPNVVSLKDAKDVVEFNPVEFNGMDLLIIPRGGGSFALEDLDMTGVKKVNVRAGWQSPPNKRIGLEIRLNSEDGQLIGKGKMSVPEEDSQFGIIPINITEQIDEKVEKLYFVYDPEDGDKLGMLTFVALAGVEFGG